MGHVHLGVIPKSSNWRNVVDLLGAGAANPDVVSASAKAAERDLLGAGSDPVFVEAVRLLLLVPQAARQDDFGAGLRSIDLAIGDRPALMDILAALEKRLDNVAAVSSGHTDLGEFAGRALIDTMMTRIGAGLPGLFGPTPDDVASAARSLAGRRGLSDLVRGFFTRAVSDSLASWLDRTLSIHVGPGLHFAGASDRTAFDRALNVHVYEATRIVQEFAPGWTGKRLAEVGTITSTAARDFGAVSLKKIVEELRTKHQFDG